MPRKKKPANGPRDFAGDIVICVGTIQASGRFILPGDRLRRDDPAVIDMPEQFRYPQRNLNKEYE